MQRGKPSRRSQPLIFRTSEIMQGTTASSQIFAMPASTSVICLDTNRRTKMRGWILVLQDSPALPEIAYLIAL